MSFAWLIRAHQILLQKCSNGFDLLGRGDFAAAFVGVPANRYKGPAEQVQFFSDVIDRLRADARVKNARSRTDSAASLTIVIAHPPAEH